MIIDVSDHDFPEQVLDRSWTTPVVVDFWAAWCGPCRALTPLLEDAARAREGQVVLAKVNTDAAPRLSASYRVQSIPAVKGFRDGGVVAEFMGAQPRAMVERFFDRLVPSEVDALVAAGDEASLRRALELDPARADATVALARLLHARGEADQALGLVDRLPGNFAAEALASRIALERGGDPGVAQALAALDAGERERALDALLAAVPQADGARDDLRRVIVGILDDLGVGNPVAREYRRRLAGLLY